MTTSSDSKKYYSSKQEKLLANVLGWSVVKGSGARNLHPGDIQSPDWLGECKTHTTPGHKIVFYQNVWDKILEEATSRHKFPVLFVDDGSQTQKHTWCMFNQLPAVGHVVLDFPLQIKTNVSFDSDYLRDYGKSQNDVEPLLYSVRQGKRQMYISSFLDFIDMFREG